MMMRTGRTGQSWAAAGAAADANRTAANMNAIRSMRCISLRLVAGLLDDPLGELALAQDELREFLRRVDRGLDRAVDEVFLPPRRLARDAHNLTVQFCDDRLGRTARREQAGPGRREILGARFAQRRQIGEQRRAGGCI